MANMLEMLYTRVDQWFKLKHIENKVTPNSQSAQVSSGKLTLGVGDGGNPSLPCTR